MVSEQSEILTTDHDLSSGHLQRIIRPVIDLLIVIYSSPNQILITFLTCTLLNYVPCNDPFLDQKCCHCLVPSF